LQRERKVSVIANTIFVCAVAAARNCAVRLIVCRGVVAAAAARARDAHLGLWFTANQQTNTNFEGGHAGTRPGIRAVRGSPC
jgi:hypothetical protein